MRLWLAYLGEDGWQSRAATLRSLGEPIKRLNEMYELGRIALPEYRERCGEIDRQQSELEAQRASRCSSGRCRPCARWSMTSG